MGESGAHASVRKIWSCKIGEAAGEDLPEGADLPMRQAIAWRYERITGRAPDFIFSGWGAELTDLERAEVENREPSPAAAGDTEEPAAPIPDSEFIGNADLHRAVTAEAEVARLVGELVEARQALAVATTLAADLVAYSNLRGKVRLREDQSEYEEAERLISRLDALGSVGDTA
jgi:hypothetical protein